MIRQLADTEGVKEGLKARNQLMWVGGVQMRPREQRAEIPQAVFLMYFHFSACLLRRMEYNIVRDS